jgi:hypothetical protein
MNRPTLSIALLVSLGSFAACSGGDSQSGIRADGLAVTCTTEGDADTEVYVCEPADGDQSCESPAEGGSSLALWPPNHKLHLIALADCAALPDDCGTDLVSATITAITADEAVDVGAGGDGHTKNYDMRIGDGRVYRVWFTNAAGTAGSCEIQVPHDQGPFGGAIDSGEVVRIVR